MTATIESPEIVLQNAAKATSIWVTTQQVDEAELYRRVLGILGAEAQVRTLAVSRESLAHILGVEGIGVPEQVSGWIGAGLLFEQLQNLAAPGQAPEYVVCIDPWAAMLIGRSKLLLPRARWVYVSDLEARSDEREYWRETEAWLKDLPFDHLLPSSALSARLRPVANASPAQGFKKKLGAWEWRRISDPPAGLKISILYSGSLLRLRVFVESLLRQEGGLTPTSIEIVSQKPTDELRRFVEVLGLVLPNVRLDLVSEQGADSEVLRLDDHLILPPAYLRSGRGTGGRPLKLDPAIAAQVLIGNLDPIPVYGELLKAHHGEAGDLLAFGEPS